MYNLIAHRGLNDKKYRENTQDAIKDSLKELYISGIEIDARITKDNKIIVIHDQTINRTSNGAGFVKNMTLKELKKYNFGTKYYDAKISTLKEILSNIKSNKIILIEIKYEGDDNKTYIKSFYHSINKFLNKNIYIMSFNHEIVKELKSTYPYLRCGLLISKIININHLKESYDFIAISSYSIKKVASYKKTIFVWGIQGKKHYQSIRKTASKDTYYIVNKPKNYI